MYKEFNMQQPLNLEKYLFLIIKFASHMVTPNKMIQ